MKGKAGPPQSVRLSEWLGHADWIFMMKSENYVLLFLDVIAVHFVWLIFRAHRTRAKQEVQRVEERQQRDIAKCLAVEEDLRAWLKMLKLPALEERM